MTGLPEPYSATNAVGMPLTPSRTRNPASLSTPTSRAAERCSSSPSSAYAQMSWLTFTSSGRAASSVRTRSCWTGVRPGGPSAGPGSDANRATVARVDAVTGMGWFSGTEGPTRAVVYPAAGAAHTRPGR